jgi:hypothetical protein
MPGITPQAITSALNGLSKQTSHPQTDELLTALLPKLKECTNTFTSLNMGASLAGLQGLTSTEPLLAILSALYQKLILVHDEFSLFSLSSAIHGLQSISDESSEVRLLVGALGDKLNSTSYDQVNPSLIANAVFGCRRMSGNYNETSRLLAAINEKIVDISNSWNETMRIKQENLLYSSKDIAKVLYGLQEMNGAKNTDVQSILRKMSYQIRAADSMNAQEIAMCLYGLKGQTDSSYAKNETKAIIGAIATKIQPDTQFTSQGFGMCLLGLRGVSSDSREVGQLLNALITVMGSLRLDAQAVGNGLYGLQSMYSTRGEVRQFLTAMLSKLKRPTDRRLNAQEISNALWGLQGMNSDHLEVRRILQGVVELHLTQCDEVSGLS